MIATTEKKVVRCGIYVRKSNEGGLEQAFNSLDAQRAMCESYVASFASEGWTALPTEYCDAGITGGTMERPGLQKLLADVDAGRVDVVVIYRLDRLSRSLRDFLNMMEAFDRRGVSFASVTERIDTTSSAGRLFLNMILAFGQFEREVAAERIRDKIASAKRKGKYVGGRVPLGYDVDREKMRLVVNAEEAKLVRHIFQLFIRLGSCMRVAQELNTQGYHTKAWTSRKGGRHGGAAWNKTYVHLILTNRRYLGEVVHKGQSYPGEHEALIDRKTWDRAHVILNENRRYRASQTRRKTAALLKGILRCGHCDSPMASTYTTRRGRRYQYYLCHHASKHGRDTCPVKSVPAGQIEEAVLTYLREIFADPEMVARTFRAVQAQAIEDRRALERRKASLEKRLSELRKAIGRLVRTGAEQGALADELRTLNEEFVELETRLHEVEAELDCQEDLPCEQDVGEALRTVEPLWAELFPAEKERIVRLLVETVTVQPTGLTIRLRPNGLMTLAAELAPEAEEAVT